MTFIRKINRTFSVQVWELITVGFFFPLSDSLQFLAFDTEASHDILKVWDGPPENEMSLRELSGSLLPEGIHSTLNMVTIQFETDFYISKSGFAIEFSSKSYPFNSFSGECFWLTGLIKQVRVRF